MKVAVILVAILALTCSVGLAQAKEGKKCRALVLEGGGDLGSYQVGVLKSFVDYLPEEETAWDVITGVSVGSINAVAIGLHDIGDEKEAIYWMVGLWESISRSDILINWDYGLLQGLFFKQGLWDNSPELSFLTEKFKELDVTSLKRKININTVEINTGEIFKFKEDIKFEDIPMAVKASSSMPFAFPHTNYDGHTFVDGGSVWNIDLSGAVERCHEIVDKDEDIIIDVVMCNGEFLRDGDQFRNANAYQLYGRYQEIRKYYGTMSDYCEVKRGFPDVKFRYVLAPQQELAGGLLPINFKKQEMLDNIEIGYEEGKDAILESTNVLENRLRKENSQEICAKDF